MTTATASSIIAAAAHGSAARLALLPGFSTASSSNRRIAPDMNCALLPQRRVKSRRLVSLSLVFLQLFSFSNGQYLEDDQPKFADCRSLLRSGPASYLRINIRAVAEYASDAGNGKYAFNEVDQCLRALEELDSLLLRASRKDSGSSVEAMKVNVATALDALNGLLKTVPAEVLDRGKTMADAYLNQGEEDTSPQILDPQLQKLESIL